MTPRRLTLLLGDVRDGVHGEVVRLSAGAETSSSSSYVEGRGYLSVDAFVVQGHAHVKDLGEQGFKLELTVLITMK